MKVGGQILSFRNFVMCLHGLDILSTWVLFFSLLCATASAFQYSHLAKDLDVLSRIVWTIHGHVLQEWTRCVFLEIVCILCADHVFWYPWFIFRKNSTVVSASLSVFGLHANILGSMCC